MLSPNGEYIVWYEIYAMEQGAMLWREIGVVLLIPAALVLVRRDVDRSMTCCYSATMYSVWNVLHAVFANSAEFASVTAFLDHHLHAFGPKRTPLGYTTVIAFAAYLVSWALTPFVAARTLWGGRAK